MNRYRVEFTAEHGAELSAEFYAESFQACRELFREDFGSLVVDSITLIDEDFGEDYCPDDSMDGDFDSAMQSAGFGTDEDYNYYGE